MKTKKKGFTLIELVIVIAVIAILAAILIPTFASIVKKSKISSDVSLIRNLNLALKAESATSDIATANDAFAALSSQGFELERLKTATAGYHFVWNQTTKEMCLMDEKFELHEKATGDKWQYWAIAQSSADFTAANAAEVSIYLGDGYTDTAALNVVAGLDVGNKTDLSVNLGSDRTAISRVKELRMRTNGGAMTINAPESDVSHYGSADSVSIIAVANDSYHEYGEAQEITLAKGHLVLENNATVGSINITATEAEDIQLDVASSAKLNYVKATNDTVITGNAKVKIPANVAVIESSTIAYKVGTAEKYTSIKSAFEATDSDITLVKSTSITQDLTFAGKTLTIEKGVELTIGEQPTRTDGISTLVDYNTWTEKNTKPVPTVTFGNATKITVQKGAYIYNCSKLFINGEIVVSGVVASSLVFKKDEESSTTRQVGEISGSGTIITYYHNLSDTEKKIFTGTDNGSASSDGCDLIRYSQNSNLESFALSRIATQKDGQNVTKYKELTIKSSFNNIPVEISDIYYCDIEQLKIEDGITNIGSFFQCKIDNVILPSSVKIITGTNFPQCSINEINLINVEEIEKQAFCDLKIKNVALNSVKKIGYQAFQGCTEITEIDMPNIETIGNNAFAGCTKLSTVKIGEHITLIEHNAFSKCPSLSSIIINNATPPTLGTSIFSGSTNDTFVVYVPTGATEAYKTAFKVDKHGGEYEDYTNDKSSNEIKVLITKNNTIRTSDGIQEIPND